MTLKAWSTQSETVLRGDSQLELDLGVAALRRVSLDFDLEITGYGFISSDECDLHIRFTMLNDGTGWFECDTLGNFGEIQCDVFVKVFRPFDTDFGFCLFPLLDARRHRRNAQIERIVLLSESWLRCFGVVVPGPPGVP